MARTWRFWAGLLWDCHHLERAWLVLQKTLSLILETASVSATTPAVNRETSPTQSFWYLLCISSCSLHISPSHPWLPTRLSELFLCRSKPQEDPPVPLPFKLLIGSCSCTFGKGGGWARSLLFLRKVILQLLCSPGPHLSSSACLGGNFSLLFIQKTLRHLCLSSVWSNTHLVQDLHHWNRTGWTSKLGFFKVHNICPALFVLREWLDFMQLLFQRLFVNN